MPVVDGSLRVRRSSILRRFSLHILNFHRSYRCTNIGSSSNRRLSALFSSCSQQSPPFFIKVMATERGTTTVADAIKDVQLEKVQGPGDAKSVPVGSFWQDQTVVIHILRRFGCKLCRHNAMELEKIVPTLEKQNVRIVAVGIEKLGLEEFQQGGFWKGELYIDNGKKIHQQLGIKSVGILGTAKMLYDVKDAMKAANNVPGNLQGDGRQLGATFVIAKGGAMLMDFRQKDFADHPSSQSILEACGVDQKDYPSNLDCKAEQAVCN